MCRGKLQLTFAWCGVIPHLPPPQPLPPLMFYHTLQEASVAHSTHPHPHPHLFFIFIFFKGKDFNCVSISLTPLEQMSHFDLSAPQMRGVYADSQDE